MLKVSHRRAKASKRENNLRSFKKPIELGIDAVELYLRKTKDGEIVVVHDADVDRTFFCF